jgi:hypothetical protein
MFRNWTKAKSTLQKKSDLNPLGSIHKDATIEANMFSQLSLVHEQYHVTKYYALRQGYFGTATQDLTPKMGA